VLADPALGGARSTRAVRNTPATCPRITTAREKRRGRKIGRLGSRSAPPVRRTATEGKMGGRKMEDGDWNLPYSARRLDHTRLHSCSVAELVPSTASAGRNFEQSSPSATADLSCSASVVTRAFVRFAMQIPAAISC
jgi:hypothetical protein